MTRVVLGALALLVGACAATPPLPVGTTEAKGTGECRVSAQPMSARGDTVLIRGERFAPKEEIRIVSRSDGEAVEFTKPASADGEFALVIAPQLKGRSGGSSSLTAADSSCSVTVHFQWGDAIARALSVTPASEASWPVFEKEESGLRVALPPTWEEITLDPQVRDASLKALREKDPQIVALLGNFLSHPDARFAAVDRGVGRDRIYALVTIRAAPFPVDPEAFAPTLISNVEKRPGVVKPLSRQRMNLAAGPVVRFDYTVRTGRVAIAHRDYLFSTFLLVFETAAANADKYSPVFDRIAESLRLPK